MAEVDEESKMAASDTAAESTRSEPSNSQVPAVDMAEESTSSIDKKLTDATRSNGDEKTAATAAALAATSKSSEPTASQDAEIVDEESRMPLPAAASENDATVNDAAAAEEAFANPANDASTNDAHVNEPVAADSDKTYKDLHSSELCKDTENSSMPVVREKSPSTEDMEQYVNESTENSALAKETEKKAINEDSDMPTKPKDKEPITMPDDTITISESTKADGSIVITEKEKNSRMERATSPIVIDDESDDEAASVMSSKRGANSNTPRKTRLECSFIDGSFCCVTCDYKTPSNIAFASHVVIHLHRAGDNGVRLCNVCKCDKIIDVVKNCPLVRNMMKLLVEQKNKWKQEQEHNSESVPVILSDDQSGNSKAGTPDKDELTDKNASPSMDDASVEMDEAVTRDKDTSTVKATVSVFQKDTLCETSQASQVDGTITDVDAAKFINGNGSLSPNDKPIDKPNAKQASKVSPVMRSKSPMPSSAKKATSKKALKIIFENGLFNCKTCNYVTESELAFRKHLWKDLHKKLECNHCPNNVHDKFNHCRILGEFMNHMYKNYKQSPPAGAGHSNSSPSVISKVSPVMKTKSHPQSSRSASCSPVASQKVLDSCVDVLPMETDVQTAESQLEKMEIDHQQKLPETVSDANLSEENDISRTLAMLDGLNQAQNQEQPDVDTLNTGSGGSNIPDDKESKSNGVSNNDAEMEVDGPEGQIERTKMTEEKVQSIEHGTEEPKTSETTDAMSKSKGYVCPVEGCNSWTTQSQTHFKTHMETKHSDIHAVHCAYCSQVFENVEGLMGHIDSEHMKYDPSKFLFRCSFDGCEFSSNVVIDFRVHNIIKHKSASSFKCCHCSQTFDTTESLISHIQSNILNLAQCTICRCTSTNKNIITKHIRSVHPGEPRKINMEVYVCCKPEVFTAHIPENTNTKGTVPPIILRRKETTYLCPCEFVAKDIYAFKEHINRCSMHRKKTIYVVPPVVKSVQAPAQGYTVLEDEPSMAMETTVDKASGIPDIPDELKENAETTEPVTDSEEQDSAKPLPETEVPVPPVSPESADIEDVDLNEENETPEPEPIPEPEPRPSVFEQLGVNQDITCDKCSYVTCFIQFHESHKKVHDSGKDASMPFTCQQCPYSTADERAFVFHFNCHQGRKVLRVYQCKYCHLTSNQNDFIEDHLMDKHPNEDIRFECAPRKLDSVQCMNCEMKFPTEKELLDHIKDVHGEPDLKSYAESVYGFIVECSVEPEEEPEPQTEEPALEPQALSIVPTSMPERRVISISPIPDSEVNMSEGHLSCTYCSYATHDVEQWKEHLKKHIGVGSLQLVMYCCRMCDWPSNDTKRVIDHCMKEHFMSSEQARDGGYETNYLEVSAKDAEENRNEFSANDEAAWEMPACVSIEKYHCDVCEFSTNEKATLSKHKLENHGTIEDDEDESYSPPMSSATPNSMILSNNYYGTRYTTQIGSHDRYICSMCPYTTDKAKHWHCHKVTHEKQMAIVNGLKCGYCKTLSTKLNTMRYHHNRYHGSLPHKFFKVSNGAVLNELVVNPEDMASVGSPYQPSLPGNVSAKGSGVLLKELLTLQRRKQQKNRVSRKSSMHQNEPTLGGFEDEDSGDSSLNDGSVIEEEEVDSNEEYQEETHILSRARHQEDPSKYCYKIPGKDLHQCIKCYFTHKYPSKVLRHFRYRHEKFCPYQCGYCDFSSVESPKIRRHIHIMHKNMPVKILGTSSDSPYAETTEEFRAERAAAIGVQEDLEYIIHKFIAKGDGNMQCCLLCGYKQEGASSLKRHLFAIHLQYYPYKCKYCDITAIERNKIVKHLERSHPSLEMRLVRLRFKGPLPEIPEHLKGMVGSDYVPGTDDSQTGESDVMDQDDNQATGLGLKITNVASVPSRDSQASVNWSNNYETLFNRGNITSAHISLNSETGHPIVTVKEEPMADDAGYGMMPSNVSIRDDEDEDDDDDDDDGDDESLPEHLGGGMFIKTELGSGIVVPQASPGKTQHKSPGGGIGEAVHKMCMYCNYTTRWNIGDVKTHILVTHLKRFPYGCKFCGFTGRDKKKLKMHCRSQHPQAPLGTGFKYLYNEYANILVVKKIGKEMYIGVKGLDSIEAVEIASRMSMQELRALTGPDEDNDMLDESEHPVPPIQTPVYPRHGSSDSANAVIKKHQLQLQQQLKSMSPGNINEPLDLSVGAASSGSAANALRDIHRSFIEEQSKTNKPVDLQRKLNESQQQPEFTNKHLQCRKCGYVHFDMYKLKVHILGRHLKQKPYACSLCGFDDFASHKVASHVAEVHGNMNAVMIKNIVQRDTEIKKYVGHVDTSKKLVRPYVRTVEIDPSTPKPFECAYCNYQARSRAKVRYHSIRKHKHMDVKVIERNKTMPATPTPKSPTSTFTPMSAILGGKKMPPPASHGSQEYTMLNPGVSIEANQNFTCSKCLQPFNSEDDLEAHEARAHAVIGVYQCVYCPSRQRHQYKMKQHQRLKHPNNPIKMVLIHVDEAQHRKKSSPIIPVRPPKQFGLPGPSGVIHPKKPISGVYQCNHCPSRISYKAKMNWHQRVKHPNLQASYDFLPNGLSDKAKAMAARRAKLVVPDWRSKLGKLAQKPPPEDMYRCKACNFATKDQFCMRNHAQAHTGYRPYKCPYCAYGNVKSFPVKMHVRKHHPNMPVKHKVERDHLREAELRQIYASPVRKSKYKVDSSKCGPPPKKRVIEFTTPATGFGTTGGVVPKEEPMSDDEQQSVASASSTHATETNTKPYCCILCGHWSTNHTGIKRHLMWEIKYKPYACPHCTYRDVHASGIEVHCGKVHKDVPVESLYRRDPDKEAYIQNLIEQSRRKQTQRNVPVASPSNKGNTGRMSINTLKIIKRHGSRPTTLNKCKECGFMTTKAKHMASHIVRHGPKRHQCGYCEFQAFYPYEIQQHSTKFHPSLPIMSSLLGNKKPGQELIEIVKMTGPEIEQLMNGQVPTASSTGTVEIPLSRPMPPEVGTSPKLHQAVPGAPQASFQAKPGPKPFAVKKQIFTAPTVSPMLDGLRIPESEFNLNEGGNYQCRYCDYENEALQHFKNHLIKHMPPRWKCFYCKCMTQLSYDLRKHIKNFHPGKEIKIVKLDPNLHPPQSFKPSRTGIAFTINLRDWKELLQGTAPPGRKDTDTVVVTEEDYTNIYGGLIIPIKQEAMEDYEDSTSDLRSVRSEESEGANSTLCFNCCYCPFSTRDTAIYAAHLQTHTAKTLEATDAGFEHHADSDDSEAEELAVVMARARDSPPVVRIMDIMEFDPIALEGLLHGNGVTSIRF